MEFVQTQIRPVHEMPLVINVPNYPRLEDMKARLRGFQSEINDKFNQITTLTREGQGLSQKAQSSNPDSETFVRVAQIKREIAQLETQLQVTQHHFKQLENEHQQWLEQFGWNIYRANKCRAELAEMGAGPTPQMQTYSVGVARPRTRTEVLTELENCVRWLAAFSQDPELAQELTTVQKQLAEAYQQS